MVNANQHTLFITGAAGYVGGMLCDQLSKRSDVQAIVALDKEEMPDFLRGNKKIKWITANTAEKNKWWDIAAELKPDVVIHTAWQIRELYGRQHIEWEWNVEGSRNIFEFAFKHNFIKKLVYFSTASLYGAFKTNTVEHRFTENEPMQEEEYSYAREKIKVEEILRDVYNRASDKKAHTPQISIVRPAAITGPRGRFVRIRFGLQSALSGQLKGNFIYRVISLMVSFVPATPWWVRQFIHEDDVTDIVELLAFNESVVHDFEIFNITPSGDPVFAPQMARSVGKGVLPVWPWMVRVAFFVSWHLTRGKIPNGRGVWRFYSYPIVLNGNKLTEKYGYQYKFNSFDAFQFTSGRYEHFVPKEERRHNENTS